MLMGEGNSLGDINSGLIHVFLPFPSMGSRLFHQQRLIHPTPIFLELYVSSMTGSIISTILNVVLESYSVGFQSILLYLAFYLQINRWHM